MISSAPQTTTKCITCRVPIILQTNDKYVRQYCETCKADALNDVNDTELRLKCTFLWGNRTIPIESAEWKSIRETILARDNNTCRFCGIKFMKFMIVDHLDGDASNNELSNFGLNCKLCDRIRHCGLAGINKELVVRESALSQLEISQKSTQFMLKHARIPLPQEIDPDCRQLASDKEIYTSYIANAHIYLKYTNDAQTPLIKAEYQHAIEHCRGFVAPNFDFRQIQSEINTKVSEFDPNSIIDEPIQNPSYVGKSKCGCGNKKDSKSKQCIECYVLELHSNGKPIQSEKYLDILRKHNKI